MITHGTKVIWLVKDRYPRRLVMVVWLVGILLLGVTVALAHNLPVNVSGREISLGKDCTINGLPATCGVTFVGWCGGKGAEPGGWRRFPGNGECLAETRIDYTGTQGLGSSVTILNGTWKLTFKDKHTLSGTVTGGTVQWPAPGEDRGCGTEVAVVDGELSGAATHFAGCLDDIRPPIIPKIWGTFSD